MSDPVPLNYGEANWQDFNNNWRKKDGDFLQQRSILRYETTVTRDAIVSPTAGMVIYNAEMDRLEVRKAAAGGSWAGLYTIDGLVIEPVASDIKLRHPGTAGSNGMVFSTTQITTQVPFTTSGGEVRMESTGLSVKTGTKTAKLTTDATDLISDTRVKAPHLWSTGPLSVNGAAVFDGTINAVGAVTVGGLLTANAYISLTHSPTAAGHATRKDYVDGQDSYRIHRYGDTMTGRLIIGPGPEDCLAAVGANPYISFHQTGVGRRAYIQGTPGWLIIAPEAANGVYFAGNVGGQAFIQYQYSVFSGMAIGRGAHGWPSLWVNGEDSNGGYRFLTYGSATYVNGTGSVGLRINNTDQLLVTNTRCSMTGHFWASHYSGDGGWGNANYVSYIASGHSSRIAFHYPGYAPQVRGGQGRETVDAVNYLSTVYVPLYASLHYTTSALRFKKEVRALRPKRALAAAWHDPVGDEVALPNIMALRPVVYRSSYDPTRLTYDDEGKPDGGTVPEPWDSVWGRESRRERLGLIADEVQYVLPSAVGHDADGEPEAIEYSQITVALLDHVQLLTERVELLEGTVGNGHVSNGHVVGNGHKAAIAA